MSLALSRCLRLSAECAPSVGVSALSRLAHASVTGVAVYKSNFRPQVINQFLLPATTQCHLDNYEDEASLIRDIKRNLYVDNQVPTTDTFEKDKRAYHRCNAPKPKNEPQWVVLKQYLLLEEIKSQDKCAQQYFKPLGLTLNVREDTIYNIQRDVTSGSLKSCAYYKNMNGKRNSTKK